MVTRDDDWGRGDHPFRDLHDAGDGKIGQRVAKDRFLHFDHSPSLGQERLGSDLTIACDPRDSSRVWLGFCDRPSGPSGTDWTLHIRFSADRGQTWSGDARTLPLTKNPSLAVDTDGRVGLLYQQFKGNRWVTNLEVTADGWATPATVSHPAPGIGRARPPASSCRTSGTTPGCWPWAAASTARSAAATPP